MAMPTGGEECFLEREPRPMRVMPWGTRRGEKLFGGDVRVGGPVGAGFGAFFFCHEAARMVSEAGRCGW